jgi:hypothetical protein
MWWDQLKQVKHIDEKRISWREFKKYFQKKYLSEQYYDKKMQEFFELKLGSMTMDEYERRFLELLRYVGFIKDEKVKIQRFLSGIPSFYSDKIHFDEPKTLEEAIRKAKYLYEHRAKEDHLFKRLGMIRREERWIRGRKDSNHHLSGTNLKHINKGNQQQGEHKMTDSLGKRPRQHPIKCWGCEGDDTVDDMGRRMPRIYAALDNRQEDYQSHMIEVEGKIDNHPIAILIDYGAFNHITQALLCFTPSWATSTNIWLSSSFIMVVPKLQRCMLYNSPSFRSRSMMRYTISHQAPHPVI